MDNATGSTNPPAPDNADKPIPIDDIDKPLPMPQAPPSNSTGVSRAPLNLGGGTAVPAKPVAPRPAAAQAPRPAVRPAAPVAAQAPRPVAAAAAGGRIVAVKTFFTKLHAGAIEFLEEQIAKWLAEHPDITVKATNVTTGDVVAKKTEPNLIITIWY